MTQPDPELEPTPATILLVDDDGEIRALVSNVLATGGFRVLAAKNGPEMRRILAETTPDLIVLDLNLPGDDGMVLCRELRARSALPVIMLTARTAAIDRILGLELGADDYVTKPFEPRELLARIRTVLRRALPESRDGVPKRSSEARFEDWTLHLYHRHLVDPDGMVVLLSGTEYNVLRAMVDHPQQVLSREQLLSVCHVKDLSGRAIDLHISRLRQKLRDDSRVSPLIKTVRGEGYILAAAVTLR
jgi:two-component system OmpR family response regulator